MVEHLDSAAAWERRAKAGYEQLPWVSSPILLGKMVELAGLSGNETVIDAATGSGAVFDALAPRVPQGRIIGFDISRDMLSRRTTPLPSHGELVVASIYKTPFSDRMADVITARQVFHNLNNISGAVTELGRVLAPGGRLIVNEYVPVTPEIQAFEREVFDKKEAGRHLFSGEGLAEVVAETFLDQYKDGVVLLDYAVLPQDSVRGWMKNSGLPPTTQQEIVGMYIDESGGILQPLRPTVTPDGDVLVDRPFAFIVAQKPL